MPVLPVSRGALGAYAVGSLANGVFSTVPTVLLLYFCTETLRIPPAWAAVILFVPKAWAIFWDPFVGGWSDRTRSRFGRRRPFLLAGAVGLPLTFAALFRAPVTGALDGLLWAGGCYFLLATCYSLFAVPYSAVPAEIAPDPAGRARLIGWRMAASMTGVLAGAGGAPALVAYYGGGRTGYAAMGFVVAAGCLIAMIAPIAMLRRHDPPLALTPGPGPREGLAAQLRPALGDARFRRLACAFLLQLTAIGAVSAATPYLVTGAFGRPERDIGVALGAMLLATIASAPIWPRLGRRFGERRMLGAAALAYAAAASAIGIAACLHAPWGIVIACFVGAGAPFAGMQVMPYTLVAHLAHAQSAGRRAAGDGGIEGVFTGIWTSTEKLGLALGPALTALILSTAGKSGPAVAGFVALVPALLALTSILFLVPARDRNDFRETGR